TVICVLIGSLLSLRCVLLNTQATVALFLDGANFDRASDRAGGAGVDEAAARLRLHDEIAERRTPGEARPHAQRLRGPARALPRRGRATEASGACAEFDADAIGHHTPPAGARGHWAGRAKVLRDRPPRDLRAAHRRRPRKAPGGIGR